MGQYLNRSDIRSIVVLRQRRCIFVQEGIDSEIVPSIISIYLFFFIFLLLNIKNICFWKNDL
jgi:hypothetical protein